MAQISERFESLLRVKAVFVGLAMRNTLSINREVANVRISPHAIRITTPPGNSDSPHKRTSALFVSIPEPRRKASLCFRHETARRICSFRLEVAPVRASFPGYLRHRCDVLPRRRMACLCDLSRPQYLAQPQRRNRLDEA